MRYRFALCLALLACSKDAEVQPGPDSGTGALTVVRGRVRMKMKMRLPGAKKEDLEPHLAGLTAAGLTFAPDYSEAYFDSTPVAWPVKVGAVLTFVEADGSFSAAVPGGPTDWTLFDPTREPFPSQPWHKGKPSDLAVDGKEPPLTEIPVRFKGGCGMNGPEPAEEAALCSEIAKPAAKPASLDQHSGCGHAAPAHAHHVPSPSPETLMSTYPPLDQTSCRDKNGIVGVALGAAGFDLTKGLSRLLAYPTSTCYKFVQLGCCVSEGGTVAELLGLSGLPDLSCPEVHHGRQCQELTLGDLELTPPAPEEEVALGHELPLAVHNNGCFGYTLINLSDRVPPLGGAIVHPAFDGLRLKHWDKGPSSAYFFMKYETDRIAEYRAPRCVRPEEFNNVDDYLFRVDRASKRKIYRLKKTDKLYRFTSGVSAGKVFNADRVTIAAPEPGCPGKQHVHQYDPCTLAMEDPAPDGCGFGSVEPFTP